MLLGRPICSREGSGVGIVIGGGGELGGRCVVAAQISTHPNMKDTAVATDIEISDQREASGGRDSAEGFGAYRFSIVGEIMEFSNKYIDKNS